MQTSQEIAVLWLRDQKAPHQVSLACLPDPFSHQYFTLGYVQDDIAFNTDEVIFEGDVGTKYVPLYGSTFHIFPGRLVVVSPQGIRYVFFQPQSN